MGFVSEFKAFATRGNVVDMAVGVIIGGAFGKIIGSLVNDIIMPPVGVLLGGVNFRDLKVELVSASKDASGADIPAVAVNYGMFIQNVIDFVIIALVIFMMIRAMNNLKKKEVEAPAAPPEPSAQEVLLKEIRDILKSNK